MNKSQLLKEIRIRARITNVESAAFYKAFTGVVAEELKKSGELTIHNFGKFSARLRKARTLKLFGSSKATSIPAHRHISFKAFSALSTEI